MPKIFINRLIEIKDYELLWFWYNDYKLFLDENNKKITKKKFIKFLRLSQLKKNLFLVILDNIRIGAYFLKNNRKIYFFNYNSYISNNIDEKYFYKIKYLNKNSNYLKYLKKNKNFNYKDVKIAEDKNKKISFINKILILGPKKRNNTIINFLKKQKIITYQFEKSIDLSNNKIKECDLILSSGYAYKIDKEVVSNFKNKIINLHATFLPWGKGIGTTFFSLLRHEPMGFSFHFIDNNFDTGNIISRKLLLPKINDSTRTYYTRLIKSLNGNFIKSWPLIKKLNFKDHHQNNFKSFAKYYSRLDFEKLIYNFPKGYDTPIKKLVIIGDMIKSNKVFFKNFYE